FAQRQGGAAYGSPWAPMNGRTTLGSPYRLDQGRGGRQIVLAHPAKPGRQIAARDRRHQLFRPGPCQREPILRQQLEMARERCAVEQVRALPPNESPGPVGVEPVSVPQVGGVVAAEIDLV